MTQKTILQFFPKNNLDDFIDSSKTSNHESRKRKQNEYQNENKRRKTQQYLDIGQKPLGTFTCPECGLMYMKGELNDEKLHKKIHSKYVEDLNWKLNQKMKSLIVWKGEICISNCLVTGDIDNDIVIKIDHRSDQSFQEKAKTIDSRIGSKMGCSLSSFSDSKQSKQNCLDKICIYIYLRGEKVIGMVSCERISKGFQEIILDNQEMVSHEVVCHIGIRRIWVHEKFRRQGIASQLLEISRLNSIPGFHINKSMVAFSSPTEIGRNLILSWIQDEATLSTKVNDKSNINLYLPLQLE